MEDHKTVLITGVSSGIGYALMKIFLNENYKVVATTRSGKLHDFHHPNLNVVPLEATSQESIQFAAKQIGNLTSGLDILVNNAGVAPDFFDVIPDYDSFTNTLDTNVTGVVFFTESLIDLMNKNGKVVFITSNAGIPENAAPNGPAYRLSKAAINMYAAMLATRLQENSITVSGVHPGWVQTKLGGDQAPLTAEQSANGIYDGILSNKKTGSIWDITLPGLIK